MHYTVDRQFCTYYVTNYSAHRRLLIECRNCHSNGKKKKLHSKVI